MSGLQLRILCFGASLVAGYSSMGAVYHPFSEKMVKMLSMSLGMAESQIEVVVDGLPGDMVTHRPFKARLERHFQVGSKPFDWTIMLGATNDLAFGIDPNYIIKKFYEIWDVPLSHGSKLLALTVPEASIDDSNCRLVANRHELNELIKGSKQLNL